MIHRRARCTAEEERAQTLKMLAEIALIMGDETQHAQPKLAARQNFGFKFPFAKEDPFPYLHLAAGPDKRLPRLGIDLSYQKDLDSSCQMLGLSARERACE